MAFLSLDDYDISEEEQRSLKPLHFKGAGGERAIWVGGKRSFLSFLLSLRESESCRPPGQNSPSGPFLFPYGGKIAYSTPFNLERALEGLGGEEERKKNWENVVNEEEEIANPFLPPSFVS